MRRATYGREGQPLISRDGDCWIWNGRVDRDNYGRRGNYMAHRAVYELFIGPIPDGHHLDHVCHTRDKGCAGGRGCMHRRCVNPDHMEVVTPVENRRRATDAPRVNDEREFCSWGHRRSVHQFTTTDGRSDCRACVIDRTRRYREKKKLQQQGVQS